jgi:hypothetical protein
MTESVKNTKTGYDPDDGDISLRADQQHQLSSNTSAVWSRGPPSMPDC